MCKKVKTICFILYFAQLALPLHDKSTKNDTNFSFERVNNCYLLDNAWSKATIAT